MLICDDPFKQDHEWDTLVVPINCLGRIDIPELPEKWLDAYLKAAKTNSLIIGKLFIKDNIIGIPASDFYGEKDRLEFYALMLPSLSEYINTTEAKCLGFCVPTDFTLKNFKNIIEYWAHSFPVKCEIRLYVQ
jgi:hypothetical protein